MKTILVDAVRAFVVPGEGINIAMLELLERYPNPKIILTSANAEQREEFGLNDMPYPLFTLEHNPEKADPSYYHQMLENFGLDANSVVYFENSPAAVASARSVGINSYHYDPEARDLDALKQFLDDNL